MLISILLCGGIARATSPPATDPTVDWLMHQTNNAPSSQPATKPSQPFNSENQDASRQGVIELSNGQRIAGRIETTAEKPIRVWVDDETYHDIPFELIESIEGTVLWERDEPEWKFKASGSDVKEYSGKTYPARAMSYRFKLTNGQTVQGAVVAPLYMTVDGHRTTYVLHKRDKGEPGQTLNELIYVKIVHFDTEKKKS